MFSDSIRVAKIVIITQQEKKHTKCARDHQRRHDVLKVVIAERVRALYLCVCVCVRVAKTGTQSDYLADSGHTLKLE